MQSIKKEKDTSFESQIISGDSKAESYTKRKLFSQLVISLVSLFVVSGIVFSQAHLEPLKIISSWTSNYYLQFILLTLWIGLIVLFFTIPFRIYGDYLLEQIYELSNQSFGGYLIDQLKAILVLILLGTPVLLIFAYFYRNYSNWWLLFASALFIYSVFVSVIVPNLILPFFYKLDPIRDENLRKGLHKIANLVGLGLNGVFSFNLSKETKKANAALVGLGKNKKVILADTLLNSFRPDEILAVFAHECGHFKKKHILKLMVLNFLLTVLGLKLVQVVMVNVYPTQYFAVSNLPLLFLLLKLMGLFTHPIQNMFSRKFEYEADQLAVQLTGTPEPFTTALEKLAEMNLADKSPEKWVEILFYSHPSIENRLKAINLQGKYEK